MAKRWFTCEPVDNDCGIERTDVVALPEVDLYADEQLHRLADAVVEYLKTQRLMPEEIQHWDRLVAQGEKPDPRFKHALWDAFRNGVVGEDGASIDEDAYLGTFAQVLFKWMRESFLADQLVDRIPRLLTGSSKDKGMDYFEILGDEEVADSLCFIVWETKGTDGEVASRTDEIYKQHKSRTPILLRGLQVQLADEYQRSGRVIMREFASHLYEYYFGNAHQKRLGGCVVHDMSRRPDGAFLTFREHFPLPPHTCCRQVCLVCVPQFRLLRERVWEILCSRMESTPIA